MIARSWERYSVSSAFISKKIIKKADSPEGKPAFFILVMFFLIRHFRRILLKTHINVSLDFFYTAFKSQLGAV